MNRPCALGASVLALAVACALTLSACQGIEPELRSLMQATDAQAGDKDGHGGPTVEVAESGTARFVRALYDGFRPQRALELVTFIDRYYRAPANQGYDEVLARLDKTLREIGFDGADPRLALEFLHVADLERAWTPVSASLVLHVEGEQPRTLHAFSKSEDVDRVMLPVNAPSCDLKAEVALGLSDLRGGMVLVTDVKAEQVRMRAHNGGAIAIVSASLYDFNEDKTGAKRHHDAIQFVTLPPGTSMPIVQISSRSKEIIEEAVERARKRGAKVRLEIKADVLLEKRPLRTLMATIRGAKVPGEAVAMVSHVQEPGACDNATGVAGLVESARALVEALRAEKIPWPDRTLVFLWGDEYRQSESWLDSTELKPIAGISSDMTGQSKETGATALLERNYDPGALKVLPPDWHTPWGAGQVEAADIVPNGLAVIARCAMADVSLLEGGTWVTDEHPWEGGSDHDKFIDRGVPAILFWHFTDFAYHTSLDRLQFVDPEEMRRTGVALLATGLALSSSRPDDLERYVRSLERERLMRVGAAKEAGDAELAEQWETWCLGTRGWLRNLCLGIDEAMPAGGK
ncbi:MAG: M28 family peptidase [Planctomycetes bacterium]|nr:M28 family peptidase [Planctomycetota bacterium]